MIKMMCIHTIYTVCTLINDKRKSKRKELEILLQINHFFNARRDK